MKRPIMWFETLIVENQYNSLHQEFKNFAIKQDGYFMPKHPYYGSNDESVFYVDFEENQTMLSDSFDFYSFVKKRLQDEFNKSIISINEEVSILDNTEKDSYFKLLENQLNSLIFLVNNSNFYNRNELLLTTLTQIINFKNNFTTSSNSTDVIRENMDTLFGYKGTVNKIKELYNSLETLDFFDYYHNQYDIFYNILTTPSSTMLVNLQCLQVNCDNQKASYILRSIEFLFSRLTFRQISNSKIFLNKRDKPFTESDLSKALNKFNSLSLIEPDLKNSIDDEIFKLRS